MRQRLRIKSDVLMMSLEVPHKVWMKGWRKIVLFMLVLLCGKSRLDWCEVHVDGYKVWTAM